jgi:hypothetical protein
MSKSITVAIIVVVAAAAALGFYMHLQMGPAAPPAPAAQDAMPSKACIEAPARPNHGDFRNRFQPPLDPATGKD